MKKNRMFTICTRTEHSGEAKKNILQLVHADLCGPIAPQSNSGKRYFLSLIDDFSRKGWIYLLTYKSKALDHFKVFKSMVEKETDIKLKCFRTDRGGEFNYAEFNKFIKEHGIRRQLTNAYTPQQNGVAERRNRTILNMVRSLLAAKKMPKIFWPEVVVWTCHILNRCPTLSVKDVTIQEAWSSVKPSVDHLRVWGCLAHTHVPKQSRDKLDKRSVIFIFLGVCSNTKGYRLYNIETKKVLISRDVIFEEYKHWEWGTDHKHQIEDELECEGQAAEPAQVQNEDDQPGDHQPEEHVSNDGSNGGNTTESNESVEDLSILLRLKAFSSV
ncbi:hypothetical protein LIER_32287 [Lithospermum erythrorhizon]|uniref:Integrase catalytic domain-containing protein n=1 Tax=Lithospermum erythrorhizon TaxID=34254 RepID=A0AAV3RX29_LITER